MKYGITILKNIITHAPKDASSRERHLHLNVRDEKSRSNRRIRMPLRGWYEPSKRPSNVFHICVVYFVPGLSVPV